MKDNDEKNMSYIVTFSDFKNIFNHYLKKILLISFLLGLLALIYTSSKPIKYPIKASFKERGIAHSHSDASSFSALLGTGQLSDKQAEAITWMSSQNLLRQLVKKLSLNASLQSLDSSPLKIFSRIKENFLVEFSYLMKKKTPGIKDKIEPFRVFDVVYDHEIPISLNLIFHQDGSYTVTSENIQAKGKIGELFSHNDISFKISQNTTQPIQEGSSYSLDFVSIDRAAKDLSETIKFETDPKDKEVIILEMTHLNRFLGTQILNELMSIYKENKLKEQKRISSEQIVYLRNRQVEAEEILKQTMNTFANEQSKDLLNSGFLNSDKAMEFLTARLQEHQKRLLTIDIDLKRLKKVLSEGYVYYDRYHLESDPGIINALLTDIRKLSQQADSIKLSLQESKANFDEDESIAFTKQIAEVEDMQNLLSELLAIRGEIEKDNIVDISDVLLNDPRIMLKNWYEKLKEYFSEYKEGVIQRVDWDNKKKQFSHYLDNLTELFEVHHNAIKQRLANHGDLKEEFIGIDLSLAQELFIHYHREINKTDAIILKLQWVLDNLYDPKFELNSLMSHLEDAISKNVITNYSNLLFKLQDQKNLSQKEQERIKEELKRQRTFLEMHLKQTMQISKLNIDLLKSKANALNKVSLALIQQQISLLEKQLDNFIANRINNLNQESLVIDDEIKKITEIMAKIPSRKISEQLIQQKLEQSRDFGREITHLFESKNISHNLEIVQSTPVDKAFLPFFPIYPKIFVYTIIGAFIGGLFSSIYFFIKEAILGVKASIENLKITGSHVAGIISTEIKKEKYHFLLDKDLHVLRKVADKIPSHTKSILFIGFTNQNFCIEYLKLMKKKGLKTIYLPLNFYESSDTIGLIQYLEGTISSPEIHYTQNGAEVYPGGCSRYAMELLLRKSFKDLMKQYKEDYDLIVAYSPFRSTSPEGKSLSNLFDALCVKLDSELLEELNFYKEEEKMKDISFVF